MSVLRNKLFLAVSLGHMLIDIFTNMGPVIVTFLSVPMALSPAEIGLALSAYQFVNGAAQPFFGWLVDRTGSRWLGPLSVAWTVVFLTLSVFVAERTQDYYLFVLFFTLAAFGSAAFHPLGSMHAATAVTKQAATATGIFFLFGQVGLGLGPILAGAILDDIGMVGIYALALLEIPLFFFMFVAMRDVTLEKPVKSSQGSKESLSSSQIPWGLILLLALIIGFRSWAYLGTVAFLPKMFQDMGWDATDYGFITTVYWVAAAVMGVLAGAWADRWGRRQVIAVTLVLSTIPLYYLPVNDGAWALFLAVAAGGLMGASHSILVVIAQDILPSSKSLASGLTLGYLFTIGAIAIWVIGELADVWGLNTIIQLGAGTPLIAAALVFFLPSTTGEQG